MFEQDFACKIAGVAFYGLLINESIFMGIVHTLLLRDVAMLVGVARVFVYGIQ